MAYYFLLDNGAGVPHEIYRSTLPGVQFWHGVLERAKKDGSWSSDDSEIRLLHDLWFKGDFDPEGDAVSESEALAFLAGWRDAGWPSYP